jgi:transcriptional regulator with XRE-family HTH domain
MVYYIIIISQKWEKGVKMFRNLEAELKRKGVTREQLAKKLNLSINTVSRKMNGESDFSFKEIVKIKAFLEVNIPLEELFAKEQL